MPRYTFLRQLLTFRPCQGEGLKAVPVRIDDVDALKAYIDGVMKRAAHHAGNVDGIALALAGAIVWRKDADSIEVMARDGETKNVLWSKIGGQKYAFSYNHEAHSIEMRRGSTQGVVLHSFSNATPIGDVVSIFRSL